MQKIVEKQAARIETLEAALRQIAEKGGFMPDEATVWFREARGRLGIAPEQDK